MNYANIIRSQNIQANGGGYKNVFLFAPRASFLSLKKPGAAGAVLGDATEITTAHTFTSPDGFFSWDAKQHSVSIKGTTTGDDGAHEIEWAGEFTIIGDSASTQEQLTNTLNDDVIALFKEADCLTTDGYVQLGDECISPSFKVEFDSKTTAGGKKEYKVTVTCKRKFFYTGAITMAS